MINALLPGEADVHHLTFRTLDEARDQYDLVVRRRRRQPVPAAARQ